MSTPFTFTLRVLVGRHDLFAKLRFTQFERANGFLDGTDYLGEPLVRGGARPAANRLQDRYGAGGGQIVSDLLKLTEQSGVQVH